MRTFRTLALFALVVVSGCQPASYAPPEAPMPPNTVMLSQMMRELSAQPGFTEAMLAELDKGGKKGAALLTPALIDDLRKRILGKDWGGLDRFPGWTMSEINPTVRVVGHVAGKDDSLESASAVHPGAPVGAPLGTGKQSREFLDVGPYALEKDVHASLMVGSTLPPFTTDGIVTKLGADVSRGDGPNALAGEHADSQQLANMLNRLSANSLDGAKQFGVRVSPETTVNTPQALMAALIASGNEVTVNDTRYFANFGHFHYKGQDVMMPFWVNTGLIVPQTDGVFTRGRPLLVPVSHAEYEWHIRKTSIPCEGLCLGGDIDVSYYFGIDGKSEWRTMDTLDQAWVLKRNAHTYTGAQAVEVTRLASLLTVAYMHQHAARGSIPFGGYYALGVCQDGVSAIEKKMTGKVTLFPNTADTALFNDPRDGEVNAMIAAIPKDRLGVTPAPERIFGSLPAEPGENGDFKAITVPGLALDLQSSYFAWKNGTLKSARHHINYPLLVIVLLICVVLGVSFFRRRNIENFRH